MLSPQITVQICWRLWRCFRLWWFWWSDCGRKQMR